MRRPPSRYLPHTYALMVVGAALTLVIVVQLVQYARETYNGAWFFVAGIITAAYVRLVVGILRDEEQGIVQQIDQCCNPFSYHVIVFH